VKRVPLILTSALVAAWLLLNGLSFGELVFGIVLAVALMLAVARLRPNPPRVRHLHLALPLAAAVVVDILRSNIDVARIVWGTLRNRPMHSGFVDIPLELHDPHALSILAMIVTSTPGTVWAGVSPDGDTLRLHVLDLRDEARLIRTIKERYERPLRRMFE
jgi:multicomponent K+:H+ antiporter subunit E